jgi:hypothetical protein
MRFFAHSSNFYFYFFGERMDKGHSHELQTFFSFWSGLQQIMGRGGLSSFLRDSARRFFGHIKIEFSVCRLK